MRDRNAPSSPSGESVSVARKGIAAPLPVAVASSPSTDTIRFRVSDESVDAFGDVVIQAGLDFPPELPAVADHRHVLDSAVGTWRDIERAPRETYATLHLLPPGVSRTADLVRALHAGGHGIASSVYFDIAQNDIEPRMVAGKRAGSIYRRGRVREISVTNFPANPSAIAVARSLGFNDAELAALSRPEPAAVNVARTTTAVAGANAQRGTTMILSEMIAAAQAAHDTAQATLGTATQALESDQSEANLAAVQRSTTDADSLFARLTTLRAAETAAARRAAAAAAPAGTTTPTPVSRALAAVPGENRAAAILSRRTDTTDVPAGTHLARVVMAASIARSRHRGMDDVAAELFGGNPEVIAIARTAVGAADTTTAGWAAELVQTETRGLLDETLNPLSIWPRLAALGASLDFAGAQSVLIPQLNVGKTAGGAWVGEGGEIPLVKGAFTSKRLSRYKLAGIVPITKELQRTSNPAAVEVMRKLLQQFVSNLLDGSLIDAGAEVPGVRPAGLLAGVAPITGAVGGGYEALRADLEAITTAFAAAGIGTNPVLLVHQSKAFRLRTMVNALGQPVFPDGGSSALGFTVIASPFVTATTAVAVAAEKFVSALDTMEFDTSEQATLTMANADAVAPTHAGAAVGGGALGTANQVIPDGGIPVSGGTGASVAGATAISLWQTWSLGIRLVMPASFGVTRAAAVQLVNAITW